MKFTFFTFGGGQFWEDVFFYQKWRIQRNLESKKYRLLDAWDIERHRGSFEECRKAFVKFIDVYQMPRQKGPMIIMLHGFAESKNVFRPLWRKALKKGYLVAAINNTITTTDNVTSQSAVSLTFDHLLSKVQFTMQTTAGVEYTVKVNSIKFSAVQTTDATYNGTVTWTTADKAAAEYSYNVTGMEDITGGAKTSVKYVIPQSCASITATIALTISGPGIPADKQDNTVTASMGFSKGNGAGTGSGGPALLRPAC